MFFKKTAKTKICGLMIIALFAAFLMPGNISPVFASDTAVITVEEIEVAPGDRVTLRVWLNFNPGIHVLRLRVEYDPTWVTATAIRRGAALHRLAFVTPSAGQLASGIMSPIWYSSTMSTQTGVLVNIDFLISPDAPFGEIPVNVFLATPGDALRNIDATVAIPVPVDITSGGLRIVAEPEIVEAAPDEIPETDIPDPADPPDPDFEPGAIGPDDFPWWLSIPADTPVFAAGDAADGNRYTALLAMPFEADQADIPEALVAVRQNPDGSYTRVIPGLFDGGIGEMRWLGITGEYYTIESNYISFADVGISGWYYSAITTVAARELFLGMDEYHFEPQTAMTRAMFVTVLSRLAGIQEDLFDQASYVDVADSQWYTAAIAWASLVGIIDYGILSGANPNEFRPYDNITREDMAAMIANYLYISDHVLGAREVPLFYDIGEAGPWAAGSIMTMRSHGIIAGHGDTNLFDPLGYATRAEVAQIFTNLIRAIVGLN